MNQEGYIEKAEADILHTYNRFHLVLDHGNGVYLYDTDGFCGGDRSTGVGLWQ